MGSRFGLPELTLNTPTVLRLPPGVRLPRLGRVITLAAPKRSRKSGVTSAVMFRAGSQSSYSRSTVAC